MLGDIIKLTAITYYAKTQLKAQLQQNTGDNCKMYTFI